MWIISILVMQLITVVVLLCSVESVRERWRALYWALDGYGVVVLTVSVVVFQCALIALIWMG